MPEDPHESRTQAAMGERVAIVETKLSTVEKDTGVIRSTLHSINGEIQKFALTEARCVAALETIVEQTKHLPNLIEKVHALDEVMPAIRGLILSEKKREGAWGAYVLIATSVAGAIAVLGTLAAGVAWLIEKFVWR